ncbi:MAG: FecR family protein [Fermentimonas sp.]|jgi:hypothetical protein
MKLDKYINYSALDFLKDQDFIRWRLFNSEPDAKHWNNVIDEYPSLAPIMKEATILYDEEIKFNDFKLPQSEVSDSISSLLKLIRKKEKQKTRRIICITTAVASISLFVVLSLLYNRGSSSHDIRHFAQNWIYDEDTHSSETKLILSESSTVILNNTESSVKYGEDAIQADNNVISKEGVSLYNQLITPCGKRSVITFSDGTKAWVNAGSRLVYPSVFSEGKREIFLDGEIYIEVSENEKKPFIIKTEQLDIRVLGTKFNVSAYESDNTKNVVLLSGAVSIASNMHEKEVLLHPDQMYSGFEDSFSVEGVDASIYILWTRGLYQFEREKLETIITRLQRNYGVEIEYDPATTELKCSGKLDLKNDIDQLLTDLSRALPIDYHKKGERSYKITKKTINLKRKCL